MCSQLTFGLRRATEGLHQSEDGFTLLELVLSLACSALLVTLLVSVFIQMTRTSTSVIQDAVLMRLKDKQRQEVRSFLDGLTWHPASLLGQDAWHWEERPGHFMVWSQYCQGRSPGPVRWVVDSTQDALAIGCDDPLVGIPPWLVDWGEIQSIRLEALQGGILGQGEELHWASLSAWDPSRPFHPLGLRIWIRWKDRGTEECLTRML